MLFDRVRTRIFLGAGAGVISSGWASLVGVGSRLAYRCGYGPAILMERFADDGPLVPPTCTILGGVLPRLSLPAIGELLRMILMPGALLGVSVPTLFALAVRLNRGISYFSGFGGEDGAGSSARSA